MKIWVDTESGTWGTATALRLLELTDNELTDFAELSDGERSRLAEEKGEQPRHD